MNVLMWAGPWPLVGIYEMCPNSTKYISCWPKSTTWLDDNHWWHGNFVCMDRAVYRPSSQFVYSQPSSSWLGTLANMITTKDVYGYGVGLVGNAQSTSVGSTVTGAGAQILQQLETLLPEHLRQLRSRQQSQLGNHYGLDYHWWLEVRNCGLAAKPYWRGKSPRLRRVFSKWARCGIGFYLPTIVGSWTNYMTSPSTPPAHLNYSEI